jgi:hypothetical protein
MRISGATVAAKSAIIPRPAEARSRLLKAATMAPGVTPPSGVTRIAPIGIRALIRSSAASHGVERSRGRAAR